jgi:TonB family protein
MRAWMLVVLLVLAASPAAAGEIDAAKLEALRVAGDPEVEPPEPSSYLAATVKVCVSKKGKVSSARIVKGSGDDAYDALVVKQVKATWRFKPYRKGKKARAVCARFEVDNESSAGVEGGCVGCVVGGVAPEPPKPENTTPTALEALRIAGDKNIVPDEATKEQIADSGKSRITVALKICLTDTGAIKAVTVLKASGFPAYDAKIKKTIEDTWQYRPFMVDGVATPVCAALTLIYVQKTEP